MHFVRLSSRLTRFSFYNFFQFVLLIKLVDIYQTTLRMLHINGDIYIFAISQQIIDACLPMEDVEKQLKEAVLDCVTSCQKGKSLSQLWLS